jgi:hypothetical protein
MGLLDKIEDKLSSNKDKDSKLEKQNYDSSTGSTGTASKLQHPISNSSGGTYGGSTGPTSGQTYDNYRQDNSGYTSTMKDRVPGSYVSDEDHIPTTTTTTTSTSARQPYDPYSSKGQETAARHGTTGYGSSHDRDYDRTARDDPSLARSRDGGITNQYSDQRYGATQTSSASPTTGSHHYGRDAAIVGGTGAAGVGAYELGKDHPSSQPLTTNTGQHQYQDASYMNQAQHTARNGSMAGGAMEPAAMGGHSQGGLAGESPGMTQAKKMGGAYEAGYRDAMEHMQKEMALKGSGSAF